MKRIGLLGGMSWKSSAEYYRLLNEEIRTRCGGLHSADLLLRSMEQDFYVGRLRERHGLEVVVPNAEDRVTVHDVIYNELCVGIVDDGSRHRYRQIMERLVERGAEGILLHVHKAVELALQ
jgi:amino-acid racemase